ncbi:MAG TPA: diaminopimelate epimerase [Pyrinomonadaceae bacterium]|jgi:diaminopimelate epimerase
MKFAKFHGYGNDYIVIEAQRLAATWPTLATGASHINVSNASNVGVSEVGVSDDETGALSDFVRRICDRHYGAGADGVALVSRMAEAEAAEADFRVRIFNPDGSEAAMSGNGTRCAAAYLHFEKQWSQEELQLATRAGVKLYRLRGVLGEGRFRFEAEIGKPLFETASIPMLTGEPLPAVRNYPLELDGGETVAVTALQMCNPNCCIFVDDFASVDWRRIGRTVETHAQFPERTNVEFIRVRDRQAIEVRVWERGVGETLSSGTGACASAVAAAFNGLTDRRVQVQMPGGLLEVHWRDDGEALLTGDAEFIYRGEL